MRARLCLAACAALGLVTGHASADAPPWDLRVRSVPAAATTSLRMRLAAAQGAAVAAALPAAPAPAAGADAGRDTGGAAARGAGELPPGPALADQVVFRFSLGFGLDGASPSSQPGLSGTTCLQDKECAAQFTENRIYGFGDVVLGSRGLWASNLAGYFASQFRFDQSVKQGFSAVPTVYDGDDVSEMQIRSAYAETEGVPGSRWLRRLYLRAGRQYRYGAAVAHFDGLTASYDTRVGSFGVFFGWGVHLFDTQEPLSLPENGFLGGVNVRLDLAALGRGPIVLTANTLSYDDYGHADLAAIVRIRRDIETRVRLRDLEGALAQADLQVRARLSAVTLAVLDLEHATGGDWRYDALLVAAAGERTDPRRYLGMERPGPRTYLSLRAGTVLLDNVDLLLRGAAAVEHDEPAPDPDDPAPRIPERIFASSYFEGGAALDLRLQRTLSFGLSGMLRWYAEAEAPPPGGALQDTFPDPLPADPGHARDQSFFEGGAVARYTEGARIFNAEAELYVRLYERQFLYQMEDLSPEDDRLGGRLSLEGWAGERLRLRAEYDATSTLASIPELRGLKSLRVILEGRF